MAAPYRAQFAAVLTVAAVALAPFAYAEPSDSGSGSTGSAGTARSGTDKSSTGSKAATEAKKWRDLEDNTAKVADDLTKAEQQVAADRIAQAQAQDDVTGIQDRFSTLQQLSSAQSALAVEMSDAADEATVLAAIESGDTAGALAKIDQSMKDRQAMMADKWALANTLADQTQGNVAVAQGIGQIMNSLGAMESVQQYDADKTREIVEANAALNPEAQADLVQQMMNLQQEVRDQLAAIQSQQFEAMRSIAKNI